MKKGLLIAGIVIAGLSLVLSTPDAFAQGRTYGSVRVLGPQVDSNANYVGGMMGGMHEASGQYDRGQMSSGYGSQDRTQRVQGGFYGRTQGGMHAGIHAGNGLGSRMGYGNHGGLYPLLEEGQIQLTGTVSAVGENQFALLNGAINVDTSQAVIQYIPWFLTQTPVEDVTIEPGQRICLLGQIVETEEGFTVSALTIRIMDAIHYGINAMDGGISGTIDSIDAENGLIVLAGIPIVYNSDTYIREMQKPMWESWETDASIQPGAEATIHVEFIDTDNDGIEDSLWAEFIMVHPTNETIQP